MKGKGGEADMDLGLEDAPTGVEDDASVGSAVAPDLDVDLDKYPPSIKYIMGNEACERFSFYGLKAILELYFKKSLMFSDNSATLVMHTFVFFAYFMSVPGGYLADAFLGKYRTILYFSLIYCFGSMFLSVTAIWESVWGAVVGLAIVAVGTGAIKACVSAFVGDQFLPGQESLLESVFGLLYFCINSGSLLSTVITPLLREYVSPAVAFGVPAVLLLMATIVFWGGRKQYRVVPPQGSVLAVAARVVRDATRGWLRGLRQPSERRLPYWDYAKATNDRQTVLDIKLTARVLAVFTLLPLFWSLFDQNGSRWVLQADLMDRSFGSIELTADQIPTLNPLFTLSMIPVFNNIIYPGCRRLGISMKPLEHKMVFGMFLTGVSFVLSGLLQVAIDRSPPNSVSVVAQIPQFFFLSCGEIMVSVTGLEFAYTQAPASMKSLVMSGWFMTTATGNLLVAVIAALDWPKELVWNFFLFAALMFLFDAVFLLLTRNYQYRDGGCAEVGESSSPTSPSEQGYEMEELVGVDICSEEDKELGDSVVEVDTEEGRSAKEGDVDGVEELLQHDVAEEILEDESLDDLEDMSLLE